jgi:hypothetical protein
MKFSDTTTTFAVGALKCVKFQKRTLILRIWSLQRFFNQKKYFLCENQPQLLLDTTVDSVMTLSAKLK